MRPPGASARCHREIAEWLKIFSHLKNLQWRYIRRQESRAQKSCQGSLGPDQDFFVTGIERASIYIHIYIYIYIWILILQKEICQSVGAFRDRSDLHLSPFCRHIWHQIWPAFDTILSSHCYYHICSGIGFNLTSDMFFRFGLHWTSYCGHSRIWFWQQIPAEFVANLVSFCVQNVCWDIENLLW